MYLPCEGVYCPVCVAVSACAESGTTTHNVKTNIKIIAGKNFFMVFSLCPYILPYPPTFWQQCALPFAVRQSPQRFFACYKQAFSQHALWKFGHKTFDVKVFAKKFLLPHRLKTPSCPNVSCYIGVASFCRWANLQSRVLPDKTSATLQ